MSLLLLLIGYFACMNEMFVIDYTAFLISQILLTIADYHFHSKADKLSSMKGIWECFIIKFFWEDEEWENFYMSLFEVFQFKQFFE